MKERVILKREYMANLRLSSYVASKFSIQAVLCLIQSILLFAAYALLIGLPEDGVLTESAFPEMLLSVYLTVLSSACMGLALSALCKNPDKAMTLSPFILVVQLVFAGIIFEFEDNVEKIACVTISRWSVSALGTSSGLEELQSFALMLPGKKTDMYEFVAENLTKSWGVMLGFCVLFCIISVLVLKNISRDSR